MASYFWVKITFLNAIVVTFLDTGWIMSSPRSTPIKMLVDKRPYHKLYWLILTSFNETVFMIPNDDQYANTHPKHVLKIPN